MIVVNSSTRNFVILGTDQIFGVEFDAGSEVKQFQCPRYVGNNLDLAGSFLRINYRNANSETDSYLIEDVTVDGENILFSWALTPKVTAYKGDVKYVLCATGPDLKLAWHTTLGTGKVLEGLEPDNSHVEEETSDVVAQLIALVESQSLVVEDVGAEWVRNVQSEGTDQIIAVQAASTDAQTEIEAKGKNTRDSIPEDYTALSAAVALKAPAIVCEAEGAAITLNDSSDYSLQGLRVFGKSTQNGVPTPEAPVEIVSVGQPVVTVAGKNLLNMTAASVTKSGVTFSVNDDMSITISGTAEGDVFLNVDINNPISWRNIPLIASLEGGSANVGMFVNYFVDDTNYIGITSTDAVTEKKFQYPENALRTRTYLKITSGATLNKVTVYPMIRLAGETDRSYEPGVAQTAAITTPTSLSGIPVTSGGNYTDITGQQWICDEVDLERGVCVQRTNKAVLTSESVEYVTAYGEKGYVDVTLFFPSDSLAGMQKYTPGTKYTHFKTKYEFRDEDEYGYNGNTRFKIFSNRWKSKDEVCAWLDEQNNNGTPVEVLYALATPIETALSETEIAAYRALHTNKPNTTLLNSEGAHMAVEYVADTKLYIDNLIKNQ